MVFYRRILHTPVLVRLLSRRPAGDHSSVTPMKRLEPVGRMLDMLLDAVNRGEAEDSPKLQPLCELILDKGWMRQWQAGQRQAREAELDAEEQGLDPPASKLGRVTLLLVQSDAMAHALSAATTDLIDAAIILPPTSLTFEHASNHGVEGTPREVLSVSQRQRCDASFQSRAEG